MDWFFGSPPPPEYQAIAWAANTATVIETVGWAVNYGDSIYRSVKDRSYGMAIFPLCLNISWEIVYTMVYPCNDPYQKAMIVTWLLLNPAIMLCAIRYAPNEWQHAPLIRDNIPLIFALTTMVCIAGQLAAAATMGPGLAANVVSCFCYLLLTVGSLCQLLIRGSSRGTSYTTWASRFIGNIAAGYNAYLRVSYWPRVFDFLDTPLMKWYCAVTYAVEFGYFFALRYIRAREGERNQQKEIAQKTR
ncbi:hypothetical protein IFM46972_10224 [Aspergillus udagawae]|uniref:Uncharacterized protein n=1 Tax=Aspergillus udagawae TaxID=91492 RepID=A0A8H3XPH6_9EURO|nr:hypothetical protein IFM46972_10224 [Aspergillus udagawae]